MSRSLSLITPSGHLTLGNYLGALRPMAERQAASDCYYGVSDLHALTTRHDPDRLRVLTAEQQRLMVAAGLDRSTLFVQSRVTAHAELTYLLECVATTGELNRMIQFKEKGRDRPSTRCSLFTYPVLMAADILLYRPETVPVGDDQRQHVELARDVAQRFNATYGEVFTVPRVTTPPAGARVMDLAEPTRKMSGSSPEDHPGCLRLLDPPDVVRRKVARAVTDSDTGADAVRADREAKPGVTNLLDILTACGASAEGLHTYGALKAAVTDAVIAVLEPLQQRYADLDPAEVAAVFEAGEQRCREVTAPVLADVRRAMGL
ncbi:tryptophan--tRNA ligase [Nocardioides mangrovicus]|uniref:Tryptophan--tRNA ligase n=1 Tax=Nocardioides mangrovicus TaxID=2478913 RepID=A0A3L8NZD8_9ACTN|nr:tryptophan--tRNA ligase [Nocardioides mangrovicus]RLV48586.1 tryptophan--tRNA ligase [Nocardioides mangrovicus]